MKKLILLLMCCIALSIQSAKAIVTSDTLSFISSDQVKLFVKASGSGTVCIFVHGGPGAWSHSLEVLGLNTLEDTLRMVYYDQRGCGRSANAQNKDYSMRRMLLDIDEIRQAAGVEKVILMGHSFGGVLAVNYVAAYPQHVKALIMLNTTLDIHDSMEEQIKYGAKILKIKDRTFFDKKVPVSERWQHIANKLNSKGVYYKLQYDSDEAYEQMNREDAKSTWDNEFGMIAWGSDEYFRNFIPLTAQISAPVLVISGKRDYAVGPKHHRKYQFKNATDFPINGKHVVSIEQNEAFNKGVRRFLGKI
jgi:proline iminopeptidase